MNNFGIKAKILSSILSLAIICIILFGIISVFNKHSKDDSSLNKDFLAEITEVYKEINKDCVENGVYVIPSVKQKLLSLGYYGATNDNINIVAKKNTDKMDTLHLQFIPGAEHASYGYFFVDFTVGSKTIAYRSDRNKNTINYTIK